MNDLGWSIRFGKVIFDYLGQNLLFDLPFLSSLVWLIYEFYYLRLLK